MSSKAAGRAPRAERGIAETLSSLDLLDTDDAEEAAQQAVQSMEDVIEDGLSIEVPPPRPVEEPQEEPEPELEMTPLPSVTPLVPPPKIVRGEKPKKGGIPNAKLGILAKMAPGAAKAKVFKRRETGELDFVREYTPQDVNRFNDFEAFIKRFCEPDYGPGEYEITGVDDRGLESALGTVRLIQPPKHTQENGVMQIVDKVLSRSEEMTKQAMEKLDRGLSEARSGQQNPIELMKGVMEMTDMLEQKAGGGKQDMVAVMLAQMNQSTQLLVQMMNKPKEEDPLLKALIAKIIDKEISGGAALPPPPPPPPPPAPFAFLEKIDIAAALTGVAALVAAFNGGKKDNTEQQLFFKLLEIQNSDRLGTKEIIQLLRNNEGPQSDSFTDTVDKIASLINVAKNLDPGGSPQNGFWDAIAAFAGNRDLGAAAMRAISTKLGGSQPPPPPAALPPAEVQKLRDFQANLLKARDALIAERRKFEEEKKTFSAQASSSVDPAPEEPRETAEPDENTANAKNNAEKRVELPPQTAEFLHKISVATDEALRAQALVDFLLYLHGDQHFRAFSEQTVDHIRRGNRAKALHNMHGLFDVCVGEGLMTADTARAALKLLNSHADAFEKAFADLTLDMDREVTRESLMTPQAGAGAQ